MPRLTAIGEAMVEQREDGEDGLATSFAGDVFNTLAYVKQLDGEAWQTRFVSAIGDDDRSNAFIARCAELAITPLCHVEPGKHLGLYRIHTDARGERTFSYWRAQSPARELVTNLNAQQRQAIVNSEYVLVSGITLAILSEQQRQQLVDLLATRGADSQLVFDPNFRRLLWENEDVARHWITRLYGLSDIALPGLEDEADLFGLNSAQAVMARPELAGNRAVIVKAGEGGIFGRVGDEAFHQPFEPAPLVVDTTAAGDAFTAGWLVARHRGDDGADAARFASMIAARVVSKPGAIVSLN